MGVEIINIPVLDRENEVIDHTKKSKCTIEINDGYLKIYQCFESDKTDTETMIPERRQIDHTFIYFKVDYLAPNVYYNWRTQTYNLDVSDVSYSPTIVCESRKQAMEILDKLVKWKIGC